MEFRELWLFTLSYIVLVITCCFDLIIALEAPRITPSASTITMTPHETRVIRCTHSEEIFWIVPDYTNHSFFNISEDNLDDSGLHFRNLSLMYRTTNHPAQTLVGSYYCLSRALDMATADMTRENLNTFYLQRKASRIFVFMKYTDVKIAGPYSVFQVQVKSVYATINSTVYLPCWPTETSVKMRILSDWAIDGIAYEPVLHLGAKFHVTNESQFTTYRCIANQDQIDTKIEHIQLPDYVIIKNAYENGYFKLNGYLALGCGTNNNEAFVFEWTCPTGLICQNNSNTLYIAKLTKGDEGTYTCTATNPKLPKTYGSKTAEIFIKINDQPKIIQFVPYQTAEYSFALNEDLNINVRFSGVPLEISFTHLTYINPSRIKKAERPDNVVSFVITNMQISESGIYKLHIKNATHAEHMSFNVSITCAPNSWSQFKRWEEMILQPGVDATVEFNIIGFPTAQVTCLFTECNLIYSCRNEHTVVKTDYIVDEPSPYNATYIYTFRLLVSGILRCEVKNQINWDAGFLSMVVMDKPEHFLLEPSGDFVAGMKGTTLTCFASKYNFRNAIYWQFNDTRLENQTVSGVNLYNEELEYMYKSTVQFNKVDKSNQGLYRCNCMKLLKKGGTKNDIEFWLILKEFSSISVEQLTIGQFGQESMMLKCIATGMPTPTLTWYKDDQPLANNNHIEITNISLKINSPTLDDVGIYECRAENFFENKTKTFNIRFDNNISLTYPITASVLLTLVLSLLGIWFIFYCQTRKKKLTLKHEFLVGNSKQINSNLSLTDQADVLPYDANYDFPASKLELGMFLGAGAFGIVLKAEAIGIVKGVERTTVAVKRVKEPVQFEHLKALIGEMKIMIHIGRHKNIVNLLGVVHENLISKDELLVITEFCGLGNLREFVLINRAFFVNQVDTRTEQIDSKVGSRNPSSTAAYCNIDRDTSTGAIRFTESKDGTTQATITTTDLVCWSYQISQGMNFLACKGVLHGDLAARNILLTTDSVVKICDFGLSRKLSPEENYEKESSTALPLKWLAIESIEKKVFNSSSDVWSFGVTMWELFTLSDIPYVEIKNEDLLSWLKDGHRLGFPMYATSALHRIMLGCWRSDPEERPRFNELGKSLAEHLSEDLVKAFEDTDAKYVAINDEKCVERRYTRNIELPNEATVANAVDFNSQLLNVEEHVAEYILLENATKLI